jgi:hypothetical protein
MEDRIGGGINKQQARDAKEKERFQWNEMWPQLVLAKEKA